jgi:GT2 family glycosyltransferase
MRTPSTRPNRTSQRQSLEALSGSEQQQPHAIEVSHSSAASARPVKAFEVETIRSSFDEQWYLQNYGDQFSDRAALEHFCNIGWRLRLDPCPWFSTAAYLVHNPDVAGFDINPFYHYIAFGKAEGRVIAPGAITNRDQTRVEGWSIKPPGANLPMQIYAIFGSVKLQIEVIKVDEPPHVVNQEPSIEQFIFEFRSLTREQLRQILAFNSTDEINCDFQSGATPQSLSNSPLVFARGLFLSLERKYSGDANSAIGSFDGVSNGYATGWCFYKEDDRPVAIVLRADSVAVCTARADRYRPDVEKVHGRVLCGFEIGLPVSLFDDRVHLLSVENAATGEVIGSSLTIILPSARHVARIPQLIEELQALISSSVALIERFSKETTGDNAPIDSWNSVFSSKLATTSNEIERQSLDYKDFLFQPLVSIVIPVYRPTKWMLLAAVESVVAQSYGNWEIILSDDNSNDNGISDILLSLHEKYGNRIRPIFNNENVGISSNTNRAVAVALGEYVAFFDHDDLLEPDALYRNVQALQLQKYKLLYSDEDSITEDGRLIYPHLKPDWDPYLLAGINYVCHFVVVERRLYNVVGGLNPEFDGAQDKEFLLRVARHVSSKEVCHIPRVIYHWRHHSSSFSKSELKAESTILRSLKASQHWAAHVFDAHEVSRAEPAELFAVKVQPKLDGRAPPTVTVIIPTKDRHDLVVDCINSLRRSLSIKLEILLVDNGSTSPLSISVFAALESSADCRVIKYNGIFNWSAINNFAAAEASGDLLLFLNNDTCMLKDDALEQMAAAALREDVGVVGAKLLYGNGRVQHAGVVIGPAGFAGHAFVGLDHTDPGYFGYAFLTRSVSAVTGACMMVRKSIFDEVGGFDVFEMGVALSDIDFCLKVMETGRRNLLIATALFHHYESLSRGSDAEGHNKGRFDLEVQAFRRRWKHLIGRDPFYNPRFETFDEPYKMIRLARQ